MERVNGSLADGRAIVWYDTDGTGRTPAADPRPLPKVALGGELRLDPLTGEWVAIASHRQTRTFMPPADECPLCPSTSVRHSEIPSFDYQVVAFENRFPAFHAPQNGGLDEVSDGLRTNGSDGNLESRIPAAGRCEVICFSSQHDATFAGLEPRQARLVVDAWADRTEVLNALSYVEFVYPFENRGEEIGVTLQHPHGQIYGFPFVAPRAARQLDQAAAYRRAHGEDLFGAVIARQSAGPRVVGRNEEWIAFVPFAARWPLEVHLYPIRRTPDLPALDDAQRDGFVALYLDVLRRFDGLYGRHIPYISAWQQAPARQARDLAWLHLELFSIRRGPSKLKYLAGTESGQGAFIGDVPAEKQVELLRAVQL